MADWLTHYLVQPDVGPSFLQPFTEPQARAFGTVIEKKGLPLGTAHRMVAQWNAMAERQGNKLRYALPDDEFLQAGE